MPEISRFFGIIIAVFYNEHNPPHFHARMESIKWRLILSLSEFLKGNCPAEPLGW